MSSTNVPCGREQRGVVRLPVLQPRRVVHGDVLHCRQRARPAKLNLAHVAHVEQAHAGAHGHVLRNQAAARAWIFDRHIPPAEIHHLGLQRAVGGIEGGLLQCRYNRCGGCGHGESPFGQCCVNLPQQNQGRCAQVNICKVAFP